MVAPPPPPGNVPPPVTVGPGVVTPTGPRGVLGLLVRHQTLVVPTVALVIAFSIGAALIRIQGVNPTYAYVSLFSAALGSPDGITRTLTCPVVNL